RTRIVMHVCVRRADGSAVEPEVAVNDAVVTSGPPYRMIEARLRFGGAGGGFFAAATSGSKRGPSGFI
ncbi:MAG: hypothetical protein ACO3G4_03850, partial [Opitutaceae bacterium]